MSDNENKKNEIPADFIEMTQKMDASVSHEIQNALDRPVTAADVQYLIDHYPYLQILNDRADFSQLVEPQFVRSDAGWLIHDFSDALASSPGEFLLVHGESFEGRGEEDDEGGGGVNPGKGTIINQAFLTACNMVQLAIERGWMVIRVVAGHPVMQWAAWMAAEDAGLTVVGYEPSKKDREKRERIHREGMDFEKLRSQIRPKKGH